MRVADQRLACVPRNRLLSLTSCFSFVSCDTFDRRARRLSFTLPSLLAGASSPAERTTRLRGSAREIALLFAGTAHFAAVFRSRGGLGGRFAVRPNETHAEGITPLLREKTGSRVWVTVEAVQ